jgi:plasmid stability protein
MPGLTIRALPAEVYARLKERARRNRRSITQEAATIIEDAVGQTRVPADPWAEMNRIREALRTKYGDFPDSAGLIRDDRKR